MDKLSNGSKGSSDDSLVDLTEDNDDNENTPLQISDQDKTLATLSQYRDEVKVRDYVTLEDEAFLNDSIINFYLNYIHSKLPESRQKSIHIFSTHFYTSLNGVKKNELSNNLTEDERSYLKVKSWTKKIDIFSKDILVFPINEDFHWYLVMVCNPGVNGIEECPKKKIGTPFFIVLDSVGEPHSDVVDKIRSYLQHEHLARKESPLNCGSEIMPEKYPIIPLQTNYSDCGVYLLHYAELIFKNSDTFLTSNLPDLSEWFTLSEITNKRRKIADDIKCLAKDQNTPMELFPDIKFPAPIERPESLGGEESPMATSEPEMDPNTRSPDGSTLEMRPPTRPDKRSSTEPSSVSSPKKTRIHAAGEMFKELMKYTKTKWKWMNREDNLQSCQETCNKQEAELTNEKI